MLTFIIFILSGISIFVLLVAKDAEKRRRRCSPILLLIARSEEALLEFYKGCVELYLEYRERSFMLMRKKTSFQARNYWNKSLAFIKTRSEDYFERIRDQKILKKSDGLSEFFKNISDIEKGSGEINDTYHEVAEEISPIAPAPRIARRPRKKVMYASEVK